MHRTRNQNNPGDTNRNKYKALFLLLVFITAAVCSVLGYAVPGEITIELIDEEDLEPAIEEDPEPMPEPEPEIITELVQEPAQTPELNEEPEPTPELNEEPAQMPEVFPEEDLPNEESEPETDKEEEDDPFAALEGQQASSEHLNPLDTGTTSPKQKSQSRKLMAAAGKTANPVVYNIEEAAELIRKGLINRQENIPMTFHITPGIYSTDEAMAITTAAFELAITHNGIGNQGDYLRWSYHRWVNSMIIETAKAQFTDIPVTYVVDYYSTAAEESVATSRIRSIMAGLDLSGKSEYEKVRTIYDWVTHNVSYAIGTPECFTAYGAVCNGAACCQGFSMLVYRMLLEAGINARMIPSIVEDVHMWNTVMVDGVWYCLDATWDISRGSPSSPYLYFLRGTNNFYQSHHPHANYAGLCPVSASDYAAGITRTGEAGTNAVWTYSSNTLTFSPSDPSKSSAIYDSDAWQEFTPYITGIMFDNIGYIDIDMTRFSYLTSVGFKGARPTVERPPLEDVRSFNRNPYGNNEYYGTVNVLIPCDWTQADITAVGYQSNSLVNRYSTAIFELTRTHDTIVKTVGADCTHGGHTEESCRKCSYNRVNDDTVEPLGHDWVEIETQPATCAKDGYAKYKCSRCTETKTETITKLGHDLKETSRTEATCTAAGEVIKSCTHCSYSEKFVLKQKEHTWKETERKAAACTEDGYVKSVCSSCKAEKTEVLEKTGHTEVPTPEGENSVGGTHCKTCLKILKPARTENTVAFPELAAGSVICIEGVPYTADQNGTVTIPVSMNPRTAAVYSHSEGESVYPTGMTVWKLSKDSTTKEVSAVRCPALDNLLQYSGTSIRLTGKYGIRIKTTITKHQRNALLNGTADGFTVKEYGTLVSYADSVPTPTYGGEGVICGRSFNSRTGQNAIISETNTSITYANVITFNDDMSKTAQNLAIRPYIILKSEDGVESILYGGVLTRSIYFVAQQLKPTFQPGSHGAEYIARIIEYNIQLVKNILKGALNDK